MRRAIVIGVLAAVAGVLVSAPAAQARERTLTLYSPAFTVRPYTHENHIFTLRPNGREAPAEPGYITAWEEQVLVASKRPDAKPLPVDKVMVHHLLYYAPGRIQNGPLGCWGASGFIGGRGEEHPYGKFGKQYPRAARARYGIENRLPNGEAPTWRLNSMVMNHYDVARRVYLRVKIRYVTGERRTPVEPLVMGCRPGLKAMSYDVPGGGKKGSTFVDKATWTVPEGFRGRIIAAHSHHHGGAKYQTLKSRTCGRRLFKARAYHGKPDHPYNTIPLKLHEPGPIANDTFSSLDGVPITGGEVLTKAALHDNQYPHVAAMGFWVLWVVEDERVRPCDPLPDDIRTVSRPKEYARGKQPFWRGQVPVYNKPRGPLRTYSGIIPVVDRAYRPQRIEAKVGQRITWRFDGDEPHTVTVANGPRGFGSNYLGSRRGTYSFTPTVKGTYNLYCYVHPVSMSQTLVVR